MPWTQREIKRYTISFQARGRGQISLYDEDGYMGYISFHSDPKNLQKPVRISVSNNWMLHILDRWFEPIVDMLRNEGPVYLHFWSPDYSDHDVYLRTGEEPIAEGELQDTE